MSGIGKLHDDSHVPCNKLVLNQLAQDRGKSWRIPDAKAICMYLQHPVILSTLLDWIGFYHLCAVDIQVQLVNELFRCTAILRIRNETNMARTISVVSELRRDQKKFEIPGQPLSGIGAGGRIFSFFL